MRVVLAVRVIFHVDKQCRDQFPAVVAAVSIFPVVQNTHDTRPFRRQSTVKWSTEGSKGRTRDQQIGFDAKGMYGYLKVEWCFFSQPVLSPDFLSSLLGKRRTRCRFPFGRRRQEGTNWFFVTAYQEGNGILMGEEGIALYLFFFIFCFNTLWEDERRTPRRECGMKPVLFFVRSTHFVSALFTCVPRRLQQLSSGSSTFQFYGQWWLVFLVPGSFLHAGWIYPPFIWLFVCVCLVAQVLDKGGNR